MISTSYHQDQVKDKINLMEFCWRFLKNSSKVIKTNLELKQLTLRKLLSIIEYKQLQSVIVLVIITKFL